MVCQERYDKAFADLSEALRLNPNDAIAYRYRGDVWKAKGEYDKAIADYNDAIKNDPKYVGALNNRGGAWYAKREFDRALADYNDAIKLAPNDGILYFNRNCLWNDKKEFDKAIADGTKAINLSPGQPAVYINRAIAWDGKGEYDKSIADYNQAITLDPSDASARNRLAWLQATCSDPRYRNGREAVEIARWICERSSWKVGVYLDTLAAAYAEVGDFDAARKWLARAIEIEKNDTLKQEYRSRLSLYGQGKPYRQEPKSP